MEAGKPRHSLYAFAIIKRNDPYVLFETTLPSSKTRTSISLLRDFAKSHHDIKEPNRRITEKNENGKFTLRCEHEVCFAALTSEQYPNRVVFKMLEHAAGLFNPGSDLSNYEENHFMEKYAASLKQIALKYSDPSEVDKVSQALEKIETIRPKIESQFEQLMQNGDAINVLEEKSISLIDKANEFKKNANDVKKQASLLNKKNAVIIGGGACLLGLGCYKMIF